MGSLFLASCSKEDSVEVIDNEPVIEVIDEETNPDVIRLKNSSYSVSNAVLVGYVFDSLNMNINNYSLSLESDEINIPGGCFALAWSPNPDETEIQERLYEDEFAIVFTISQEGIDVIDEWINNGSDPTTEPDINSYITTYNASDLDITASNKTATTVDFILTGDIVDDNGDTVAVDASFTADIL